MKGAREYRMLQLVKGTTCMKLNKKKTHILSHHHAFLYEHESGWK